MPGLYNITSNANVSVGDTIGLYQQSGGNVYILNNAQQLLNTLSQNGNVNFALDPAYANTRVLAFTANIGTTAGTYGSVGTIPVFTVGADGRITSVAEVPAQGGTYGNANVAAYLPTYTGTLDNSSTIIALVANVTAANLRIQSIDANLGAFEAYANATFGTSNYSNVNAAAYLTTATINTTGNITAANLISNNFLYPNGVSILTGIGGTYSNTNVAAYLSSNTDPTISNLNANAAVQAVQIDLLNANVTAANVNIQTLNANLGSYQTFANANVSNLQDQITGANIRIQTLDANVGAYETWANANFITTSSTYGNSNVAAFLPTYGGNIGNATTTGTRYINSGNTFVVGTAPTANGGYIALWTANSTISPSGAQDQTGSISIASREVAIRGNLDQKLGGVTITGNTFLVGSSAGTYNGNLVSILLANTLISSQGTGLTGKSNYGGYLFVTNNITTGDSIYTTNGVFWSNGVAYSTGSGTYGNTEVAAFLPVYGGNIAVNNVVATGRVTATGNVTTSNRLITTNGVFWANGTVYSTASGTYGNTEVAAFLPIYGGNIDATVTTAAQPYITSLGGTFGATKIFQASSGAISANANTISISAGQLNNSGSGTINILAANATGNNGGTITVQAADIYVGAIGGPGFDVSGSIVFTSPATFNGNISQDNDRWMLPGKGIDMDLGGAQLNMPNGILRAGNIYIPQTLGGGYPNNWLVFGDGTTNAGGLGIDGDATSLIIGSFDGNATVVANVFGTAQTWNFDTTGNLVLPGNSGAAYITYADGSVYGDGGGGNNFTSNLTVNSNYIIDAILEDTREKTANIGVIQGVVTVNANIGPIQLATVTANITINTNDLTNFNTGQSVTLVLTQNTNANLRVLTSNLKYAGGSKTLSTANAAIDTISITYDGTNYLAALVKGYV